jgi:hypothetical protein
MVRVSRVLAGLLGAVLIAVPVGPAMADMGDVSVGGVWCCRLTQGIGELTLEQRMVEIERRITLILSTPRYWRGGVRVTVRPMGANATIAVDQTIVLMVTPEGAAATGVRVTPFELAHQWAGKVAAGLNRALPDAQFRVF